VCLPRAIEYGGVIATFDRDVERFGVDVVTRMTAG